MLLFAWPSAVRGPCDVRCVRTRAACGELACVNTTDATTGATALLLPAQNTHTLHVHDPIRDTEYARARGVEDGLGVGVGRCCARRGNAL